MRTRSSWPEDFSLFGASCQNSIWTFLHFFGVYLLSIQGTKALSLCFVLKLLYCLADLYLSLSLMSWFSSKIKENEKKKENPVFAFLHCDPFLETSDSCQEANALKLQPESHLPDPTVTKSRALSPGMCRQRQADLATAPAGTSWGQSLEGRHRPSLTRRPQTPSHVSDLQGCLPRQEPVTLLKARPWREVSENGREKESSLTAKDTILQRSGSQPIGEPLFEIWEVKNLWLFFF